MDSTLRQNVINHALRDLQLLYYLHELFAQTDGIALRHEYHAVEGVGDEEYRTVVALQFQFFLHLGKYFTVYVGAPYNR